MKEGFQNEKVRLGVCQQTNLLADQVAHVAGRGRTLSFKELSPRNRARNQCFASRDFTCNTHRRRIDGLGLLPEPRSIQFFPRSEEGESLQHLRASVEKLAVQLAQSIGMLDGYFGRELSAAFAGPDLFAP